MSVAWVGAGIAAAGVLSNANSASKAKKAQTAAAADANRTATEAQDKSIAFQQQQADQARADQAPWREAGANALTQLQSRMGPGGDLMSESNAFRTPFQFEADPGYQFRVAEGMKGITNSAAARGGLLSGAALKAASQYNQNMGSAEYGNAFGRYQTDQTNQFNRDTTQQTNKFNRLASLAGVGQTAANQTSANAMSLGSNVGNTMFNTGNQLAQNALGVGNVRASSYLAQGNALTNGLNQAYSAWKNNAATPAATTSPAGTYWDGYGNMPIGSN